VTARQHHYVPQCYLKGFVTDRDKPSLFAVDFRTQRYFNPHPKNVAAERDFNRIDAEGYEPDALENDFARFEGELDTALRRITDARSIKGDTDRAYLFNLIAMIAIKNPRRRESFRSFHEQMAKMIMDLATATPERWASQVRRAKKDGFIADDADTNYAKMREFVENNAYRIETTTDYHLELEMSSLNTILPLIFGRTWMLFKAPPGSPGFITSDHPVCLMWSDPKRRGTSRMHPPGFGIRKTQVLFPISKALAVIGAFELDDGDEIDATDDQIAAINGSIILHASHQVYAKDRNFFYIMTHHKNIMPGNNLLNDECFQGRADRSSAED
jgi:Protein of unknown function (DUF4238)